jgi:hypothetical protein
MVPIYPGAILQIDCAMVAALLVDKVRDWRKAEVHTGPVPDIAKSKESPFEITYDHEQTSSKGQTTVPLAVRAGLDLKKGDEIAYEIDEILIILTRAG